MYQANIMLGSGSHGSIFSHSDDPNRVVKRICLYRYIQDPYGGGSNDYLTAEALAEPLALMRARNCHVPNIVQMYQIETDDLSFEMCITMQRLEKLNMAYTDEQVRKYIRQLFEAVAGLHKAHIYHCDLKIENLMLTNSETATVDGTPDLKLIDFGLARIDQNRMSRNTLQFFTKPYRAPEIMLQQKSIDLCKADTWAAGVCAAELLLNREFIFGANRSTIDTLSAIMMAIGCPGSSEVTLMPLWSFFYDQWDPDIWASSDTLVDQINSQRGGTAADFILRCLKVGPSCRPTAEEMLNHPYLRGGAHCKATAPHSVWLTEPPKYDIASRFFQKYDVETIVTACALLDHLSLPKYNADWFLAACDIVATYKGIYLAFDSNHMADKQFVLLIMKRPETLNFLCQNHMIAT